MNGKRSLILQKHQIGHTSFSLTIALIIASIGLVLTAILSAAAQYTPNATVEHIEASYTESTTSSDLEYIETITRQQALSDYYSDLVGSEEIVTLVLAAAREYSISDVEVLFAIMWKESSFRPTAINRNARSIDRGLFQLNSQVYPEYPVDQFFNIEWNIRTGVRHYATELAVANGDHQIALHAYNAGRARRYEPPASTKVYAIDVLQTAQRYRDEKRLYIQTVVEDKLALYSQGDNND